MSDTDKAIISESYINMLQHRIEELEAQLASAEQPDLAEALQLLKLAACPANCYGGAIDCGGYQHPCQWCDEVEALVAKIKESTP